MADMNTVISIECKWKKNIKEIKENGRLTDWDGLVGGGWIVIHAVGGGVVVVVVALVGATTTAEW